MKAPKNFFSTRAFTLIEIVMAITLIGIIIATIVPMLSSSIALYHTTRNLNTITTKTTNAMTRMQKELSDTKQLISFTNTQITFINFDGLTISYRLNGANLERRQGAGSYHLLLDDVSSYQLNFYDINLAETTNINLVKLVIIELVTSNQHQQFNLQNTVYMENL